MILDYWMILCTNPINYGRLRYIFVFDVGSQGPLSDLKKTFPVSAGCGVMPAGNKIYTLSLFRVFKMFLADFSRQFFAGIPSRCTQRRTATWCPWLWQTSSPSSPPAPRRSSPITSSETGIGSYIGTGSESLFSYSAKRYCPSKKEVGQEGHQSIRLDFVHNHWCFLDALQGILICFKFQKTSFSV